MPKIVIFVFLGIILLSGGSIGLMMYLEIGPFANEEKKANVDNMPKDEESEKKTSCSNNHYGSSIHPNYTKWQNSTEPPT